jgi:predicted transcriptional regulator
MGKITIRIDDLTEQRFREVAKNIRDGKKGYLGRATTEAISLWIRDKEQETIAQQGLALLEKEHHPGKWGFLTREDIHDRNSCPD